MDVLEKLQARVTRNPFNNWPGLQIRAAADGHVEVMTPWRDEFGSMPEKGATHGGILASILDTTCCYAVVSSTGKMASTVDLRIDYHGVAQKGPLRAEATIVRSGQRLATVDGEVFDERGRLVASGRGTFIHLPDVDI